MIAFAGFFSALDRDTLESCSQRLFCSLSEIRNDPAAPQSAPQCFAMDVNRLCHRADGVSVQPFWGCRCLLPLSFLPFPVAIWGLYALGYWVPQRVSLVVFRHFHLECQSRCRPFSHLSAELIDALLITNAVTLTAFSLFTTSVHGELQRSASDLTESASRYRQMFRQSSSDGSMMSIL